jgi:hypothetical protein
MATSLFFMLVCLFWFQSTFLVWPYGALDGSLVDWKSFADKEILEIAVWVSAVLVCLIFHSWVYRALPYALSVLVVMLAVDGWTIQHKAPIPDLDKLYVADESGKYDFSSEKNVLVFILDGFQGSVFNEIIESTPRYAAMFDGFSFYRNALCAIPSTKLSISNILTGLIYDNTIPVRQYQRQGLITKSLPLSLRELGFDTEFYSFSGYGILPLDDRLWSNERRAAALQEYALEYVKLIYATAFRLSPQVAKKAIYNQGNWKNTAELTDWVKDVVSRVDIKKHAPSGQKPIGKAPDAATTAVAPVPIQCCGGVPAGSYYDIDFLNGMLNHSRIGRSKPMFKVFHLQGLHPPRNFDENFRFDPSFNESHESMPNSGRASLKIMDMFLNKLKEMGIYDSSIIVILSDHGNARAINPSQSDVNRDLNAKSLRLSFDTVKGTAVPLILIKLENSTGVMKVLDIPVDLGDIPNTIMGALGKPTDFPGKSMLETPKEDRKRFFYVHAYHEVVTDYYGDLQEFVIDGDVYKDESWSVTGRLFKPKETGISKVNEDRAAYLQDMLPLKPIAGGKAFAEPEYGYVNNTCSADKAFDRNRETGWEPIVTPDGPCAHQASLWLKLDKPCVVKVYSIKTRGDIQYQAPKTWTFKASQDGQTWVTLHSVQGETHWEAGGKVKIFKIDNQEPFNYYKIKIEESQTGGCIFIDELELFE